MEEALQPVADFAGQNGCSVSLDGWTNTTNRPLPNYMLSTPKGDIFLESTDTSGEQKTGAYIAGNVGRFMTEVSGWS